MKITFVKTPIYTSVRFTDTPYGTIAEYLGAIRRATSAQPKGYQHMPSYRNKTWDGFIRLCKNNRFPTGLLPEVIAEVKAVGPICIEIDNTANDSTCLLQRRIIRPDIFQDITLRDYQIVAANTLLDHGRGVAKMATNSGKTEVIAALCYALPVKTLVLTTKRELMYQTSERLSKRLGEEVGYIGDSEFKRQRVTVAMIQTLSRKDSKAMKMFEDVQCVMYDECHHASSTTSQNVMLELPAPVRFGFSGTPLHHDDLEDMVLIGATGPVLVDVSNADLIEAGVSAMPHVDMYMVQSDKGFTDKWDSSYTNFIVNNENRNNIIAHVVKGEQAAATLILVDRLEHGRILKELIPGAIFAHGSLSTEERRAILDTLRHGKKAVVIATPIFDEGVDVPSVELLVIAAGGEAHIRLMQRIGRGMRRKDSNVLHVIDFVDDTNMYLLNHSKRRAELYEAEGFVVRLVEQV